MSDDEFFEKDCADGEVICEFFGIKIITKNPNIARVLTANVYDILRLDVRNVGSYLRGEIGADEADETAENKYRGETNSSLPYINIDPEIENI